MAPGRAKKPTSIGRNKALRHHCKTYIRAELRQTESRLCTMLLLWRMILCGEAAVSGSCYGEAQATCPIGDPRQSSREHVCGWSFFRHALAHPIFVVRAPRRHGQGRSRALWRRHRSRDLRGRSSGDRQAAGSAAREARSERRSCKQRIEFRPCGRPRSPSSPGAATDLQQCWARFRSGLSRAMLTRLLTECPPERERPQCLPAAQF